MIGLIRLTQVIVREMKRQGSGVRAFVRGLKLLVCSDTSN